MIMAINFYTGLKDHEGKPQKKASSNTTSDEPDPLITYLTLKQKGHSSSLDREYVESVFEGYSVKAEDSGLSEDNKIITSANAVLAYKEIFKTWKITLTSI